MKFSRFQRLLTAKDFKAVFDNGFFVKTPAFFAYAIPSRLPLSRLGLAVAKRRAVLAVQRNRLKRLIRENFRQHDFTGSVDIVVGIRNCAVGSDNLQLHQELNQLWQQIESRHLTTQPHQTKAV